MALQTRFRTKAQSVVLRILAKRGIVLMRKLRYDRIRRQDLEALVHAIGRLENYEIEPTPSRISILQQLVGTSPSEAAFIIIHLQQSLDASGDVCEFGVGTGATSALLASEIADSDRDLWLYDSFAGLPRPTEQDVLINDIFNLGSIEKYQGRMTHSEVEVLKRLHIFAPSFHRFNIVKGTFTESADMRGPSKICFAYVDFDFYQPIKDALRFVDRKLSPGGSIIVDDYDFFSAGAKQAVDEFMETRRDRYDFRVLSQNYGHFCILRRRS